MVAVLPEVPILSDKVQPQDEARSFNSSHDQQNELEKSSEKVDAAFVNVSEPDSPPAHDVTGVDWTPEEERRVRWKTDLLVMPLLFFGFYMYQVLSLIHI